MSTPSLPEPPEVQEGPAPKSFPARLIGVFVSPREAFADISRRPDWIAPFILLVVCAVAVTETMLAKIGMERIIRHSLEQSSRASQMSPEQVDQAVQQGVKVGAIFTHAFGLLITPIILLVLAGLGLLVVNVILGGHLKFKQSFAVACYANLVGVLSSVMAIALILFGDPEHYNPSSPVPSNLGFFLDPSTSKPLLALAGSLDLFSFWMMGLLGIGYSEATGRKVKAISVFLIFFGLWIVWVLIKMGFALIGS